MKRFFIILALLSLFLSPVFVTEIAFAQDETEEIEEKIEDIDPDEDITSEDEDEDVEDEDVEDEGEDEDVDADEPETDEPEEEGEIEEEEVEGDEPVETTDEETESETEEEEKEELDSSEAVVEKLKEIDEEKSVEEKINLLTNILNSTQDQRLWGASDQIISSIKEIWKTTKNSKNNKKIDLYKKFLESEKLNAIGKDTVLKKMRTEAENEKYSLKLNSIKYRESKLGITSTLKSIDTFFKEVSDNFISEKGKLIKNVIQKITTKIQKFITTRQYRKEWSQEEEKCKAILRTAAEKVPEYESEFKKILIAFEGATFDADFKKIKKEKDPYEQLKLTKTLLENEKAADFIIVNRKKFKKTISSIINNLIKKDLAKKWDDTKVTEAKEFLKLSEEKTKTKKYTYEPAFTKLSNKLDSAEYKLKWKTIITNKDPREQIELITEFLKDEKSNEFIKKNSKTARKGIEKVVKNVKKATSKNPDKQLTNSAKALLILAKTEVPKYAKNFEKLLAGFDAGAYKAFLKQIGKEKDVNKQIELATGFLSDSNVDPFLKSNGKFVAEIITDEIGEKKVEKSVKKSWNIELIKLYLELTELAKKELGKKHHKRLDGQVVEIWNVKLKVYNKFAKKVASTVKNIDKLNRKLGAKKRSYDKAVKTRDRLEKKKANRKKKKLGIKDKFRLRKAKKTIKNYKKNVSKIKGKIEKLKKQLNDFTEQAKEAGIILKGAPEIVKKKMYKGKKKSKRKKKKKKKKKK